MTYELVYDVATTSQAPRVVLVWTAGLAAVAVAWGTWLRAKGRPLSGGAKWFAIVAVIFAGVTAVTYYEQRTIASRADALTVEGPIVGLWQKAERTRRADRSWQTTRWEGFWVDGVGFVYATNVEQNYFHNGGPTAIPLTDGMRVRLRYVVNRDDGRELHEIVRFELASQR